MTVPVQDPFTASTANGVTTVFPYGFKIAAAEDLVVTIDDVIQTSGYTVSGVGNQSGGNVTFDTAPANGAEVIRYLDPVLKRDTDYQQFGDWRAQNVNLDFDRIWLALRSMKQLATRAIKMRVNTTDDQVITEAPADRALKVIGFDALGKLKLYIAQAGSSLIDLGNKTDMSQGVALVGGAGRVVDSIAALKALPKTGSPRAFVLGYYSAGDGGGGAYWYDSTDTTSTDNGGTIIVASDGSRWKLAANTVLSVLQFGADPTGVSNSNTAFANAPDGAVVPAGTYLVTTTVSGKGFSKQGAVTITGGGSVSFFSSNSVLDRAYVRSLPLTLLTPPAQFNDVLNLKRMFNGTQAVYLQDPYDVIDFTKNSSLTINKYYVNYSTGNDSNAGTSSGAAWKSLNKAFTSAVEPAIIYLEDAWVGYLSITSLSRTVTGRYKIVSAHSSGRTRMVNMREDYTQSTFNFADEGSGCWSTSTATTSATIFGYLGHAMFDAKYQDENGGAMPIPDVGSAAACIATPGSQYHDTANSKKYIHLIDGRKPDPADGWIYSYEVGGWALSQGSSTGVILLEGLQFYMNVGSASNAVCRYRHSTTATNSSRYGAKNCLAYGGSNNGFETYDADVVAFSNSYARYNRADDFNYHSFQTTGVKGEYMTVYEYKCAGSHAGYSGFPGQAALGTSCNASTSHDSLHIERMSCNHAGGNGPTVADVNGVVSVNWCVNAGPATGGSFKSCFWHESYLAAGTYKGMWLWGCSANNDGDSSVRILNNETQTGVPGDGSNDGQIYVKYWRGQTDGPITGTIKKFDGSAW